LPQTAIKWDTMTNSLSGRFAAAAERIQADFNASRSTTHHGSRGTEREEILANILRLYLPGHVEVVHNAEIVSASGQTSGQCDILLIDNKTPKLQDLKSIRIVPAECVYYWIEVKSNLTGPELVKSLTALRAVRSLRRDAYVPDPSAQFTCGERTYPILPIGGAIFAYASIGFESIGKKLWGWCQDSPVSAHPDDIWINNKGFFYWSDRNAPSGRLLNVTDAADKELRSIEPGGTGEVLLAMITRISGWLTNARLPAVQLPAYLNERKFYYAKHWPEGRTLTVGELWKRNLDRKSDGPEPTSP
jgi:hypothetical protein